MTNAPATSPSSTPPSSTPPAAGASAVVEARPGRLFLAAAVLALVAGAIWFAWLGITKEYYVVDGNEHGPYRPWQVIGAGVSMVVATVVAYLSVRGVLAVFVLPLTAAIGFAVPWTVDAAVSDDSGLFVIGAVLVYLGVSVGLGLVLGLVAPVANAITRAKGTESA
jgi:hypothetical protein